MILHMASPVQNRNFANQGKVVRFESFFQAEKNGFFCNAGKYEKLVSSLLHNDEDVGIADNF